MSEKSCVNDQTWNGVSMGVFLFSWIFKEILETRGLNDALVLVSGATGVCGLLAIFLKVPEEQEKKSHYEIIDYKTLTPSRAKTVLKSYFACHRMMRPQFVMFLGAISFTCMGMLGKGAHKRLHFNGSLEIGQIHVWQGNIFSRTAL